MTLTPSENYVEGCHIERFSRFSQTYSPGVKLYGVGDRVAYCTINNAAHMGVYFLGNNNIIEYNEIYDVIKFVDDMGAIYAGRGWTSGGTVIRHNYIHDCYSQSFSEEESVWRTQGIYLDDGMAGTHVYGNLFENIRCGVFMHFARNTIVENNVFINCDDSITIHAMSGATDPKGTNDSNNIIAEAAKNGTLHSVTINNFQTFYNRYLQNYAPHSSIWDEKFPYLKNLFFDQPYMAKDNVLRKNIVFGGLDIRYPDMISDFITIEDNYKAQDDETPNDLELLSQKVQGFSPLLVESAGVGAEFSVGKFDALTPVNQAIDANASEVNFAWEPSDGANLYRLTIATDKEFNNIVFNDYVSNTFKALTGLKYDRQNYYWYVTASSTSTDYDGVEVLNDNGVMTFRTRATESIFADDLDSTIKESHEALEQAVEGDLPGQFIVGAKEQFSNFVIAAEKILAKRNTSQKEVDTAFSQLKDRLSIFKSSKNIEELDVVELIRDSENWLGRASGIVRAKDSISFEAPDTFGYVGERVGNHQLIKMKARFMLNGGWSSVGLRAQSATLAPWSTQSYVFLVKPDIIELQKFNGTDRFYHSVDNKYIQNGKLHNIVFGAITEGNGVRVTLKVDGDEVFNVFDDNAIIEKSGFFTVYNSGNSTVQILKGE